jgi:hypothetical protein
MSVEDCMAVPEIAKYLRVSVSTVYELLPAGAQWRQTQREHLAPGRSRARGHLQVLRQRVCSLGALREQQDKTKTTGSDR